ncbi:hypothetical protein CP533_6843 [Ophiocordyceps camponoti-saundersi (nom. inval.)]|nr:hypothetical protein CP533_6843 [Ophiocordyceps camponoti-saundersi (nom. inval.)]
MPLILLPRTAKPSSAKIAPRAKEGRLVGIEGLYGHIYKIYLPEEDKIIRARDVRFYNPADLKLD